MKSAVVVLATAALASAAVPTGFQFLGVESTAYGPGIPILAGQPNEVWVAALGSGDVYGMSLFLETDAPFAMDALGIDDIDPGCVFSVSGGTSTGEDIYTFASRPDVVPNAQLAVGYVTTPSGAVPAADGGLLAKITISVPAGTPDGTTGLITTNGPTLATPSDFVDPTGQAEANLIVVPEPATALFLLGALPLIRRRRA